MKLYKEIEIKEKEFNNIEKLNHIILTEAFKSGDTNNFLIEGNKKSIQKLISKLENHLLRMGIKPDKPTSWAEYQTSATYLSNRGNLTIRVSED